jgi:DNA-binding transcriptional MerR regulator
MLDVHVGVKVKGWHGMRIDELAVRTGVARHRLRYYEDQGLLPARRSANGYREYDGEAVTTVFQIRGLLGAGLTSHEIRRLLCCAVDETPELEPCPEVLDVLRGRLADLDGRIDLLVGNRRALARYLHATERTAASR